MKNIKLLGLVMLFISATSYENQLPAQQQAKMHV